MNKLVLVLGTTALLTACSEAADHESDTRYVAQGLSEGDHLSPSHWRTVGPVELSESPIASEKHSSLQVRGQDTFRFETLPFEVNGPIVRLGFDVLIPDDKASWSAELHVNLDCAEVGLNGVSVGMISLEDFASSRFEPVSLTMPLMLRERLSLGCDNLVIRFEINSDAGDFEFLLDRIDVDYSVARSREPLCGIFEKSYDLTEEVPNGYLSRHLWRAGVGTQREIARVGDALADAATVMGYAVDDENKQFVVVVNPASDVSALADSWEDLSPRIPITVRPACRSTAEVEHARKRLLDLMAGIDGYYSLDASWPRFDVRLSQESESLGGRIQEELGELVRVTVGEFGLHGRFDDGVPHYGAAAISAYSGQDCTGGFVADKGTVRGAVSAGHCAIPGDVFASGPYPWGQVDSFASTGWDMVFIEPQGPSDTFTSRIHTDPCCPASRPVTAKSPPYLWQTVCISGRNFLAKCSVTIQAFNSTMNIGGTSFNNVWVGRRAGVDIAAPGDSGAPLYIPVGFGEAAIVGMHIGGLNSSPHDETWFHSVSDVEAQLGVSVAY